MKKLFLYLSCVILVLIISTVFTVFCEDDSINKTNIDFFNSFGWEVSEKPIEKVNIKIPQEFDDVYENYNILQKECGLDLSPYKGKNAVRYTYTLKNFPEKINEPVRANVICVNSKPVAGDIMTVSLGGFMYSLNFNLSSAIRFTY